MKNIVILALIALNYEFVLSQSSSGSDHCASQMENYRQCIKKGLDTGHGSSQVTSADRKQLQSDVEKCFLAEKCKSPFLSKDYQDATKSCFQSIRDNSRKDLESCVRRDIPDFVLPQDEAGAIEMRQSAVSLLVVAQNLFSVCPLWVNKARLADCVKSKSTNLGTKTNANNDLCLVRQDCEKQISPECSSKWNSRAVPSLCRCVNDKNLNLVQKYKQNYTKCVEGKKYKVLANDPTQFILESNIKGWCPASNAKNPCIDVRTTTKPSLTPAAAVKKPEVLSHTQPISKFNPNGDSSSPTDENEESGPSPDNAAETTTIETTTTTTTTEMISTTTEYQNQDFFSAMMADPVFQSIIGSNPTLTFFHNLFSGKTDLSSIFPSANFLGNFQGGLSNMFGNVGTS